MSDEYLAILEPLGVIKLHDGGGLYLVDSIDAELCEFCSAHPVRSKIDYCEAFFRAVFSHSKLKDWDFKKQAVSESSKVFTALSILFSTLDMEHQDMRRANIYG